MEQLLVIFPYVASTIAVLGGTYAIFVTIRVFYPPKKSVIEYERRFKLMEMLENGAIIPETEYEIARTLESVGLIRIGYDDEDGCFKRTGSLSALGKRLLNREKRVRKNMEGTLYEIIKPLI